MSSKEPSGSSQPTNAKPTLPIATPIAAPMNSTQASTGSMNASTSPQSSNTAGLFGWIKTSVSAPKSTSPISQSQQHITTRRPRRDSSILTPDEALNISRANAKPIDIPRPHTEDTKAKSSLGRSPSNSKYDKLGLITAFSGGPGSF